MTVLRVFIGWDPSESEAWHVAESSLRRRASIPVDVTPLNAELLRMHGLLRRPVDARGGLYDIASNAPASTEFATSRFLVPLLAQSGVALFVDCDVVFLSDVAELLQVYDESKAAQVVKHNHKPRESTKMGGVAQTAYPRKNWASVILWNCSHHAHRRLSLDAINNWPGRDLHAFSWLHDSEVGDLPAGWNWLVDVQPRPQAADLKIAHMTLGGPWIHDWSGGSFDAEWLAEAALLRESR